MHKIHNAFFLAMLIVTACKKPHFPHQPKPCPATEDCLLTALHTTQGLSRDSEGPENSSEIFRNPDNRPYKHRGYMTGWETKIVSNITYAGNRMTLTDSGSGIKRMDVWFNSCGQPDSAKWYPTGLPNEFPTRTYYQYNSTKKLTGFTTYFNEEYGPGVKKDVQIIRDAHGNVLKLTDGMSITEWTYDYNQPIKPAQIYYVTNSTPIWSTTFLLEQFGLIDFRPRHVPKSIAYNMSGYQFDTEQITDVVISRDKVVSYVHRVGDGGPNQGLYIRTVTLTYKCKSGHKKI
ncbi:hypothetical protein WJU16_10500 [Chitinophaga pollutisoli]|uniref:YD repeat-containing protein n=1 Tax=Chitinophaga pollutisoli TaxID=3133966 RepID=A0ABZ2YXZ5_9BACT